MRNLACIALSPEERDILQNALAAYANSKRTKSPEVTALSKKLQRSSFPKITVGIGGGMVQWTSGNPFPIRVCDYDVEGAYPKYVDERGRRCVISFEPPDPTGKLGRYRTF